MAIEPKIYYVRWRTWKEEQTTTPWDFWYLKQGTEYRLRKGGSSSLKPTVELIQAAFERQNSAILNEIDSEFVQDVCLAAFVLGLDENDVQQQVKDLFEDAEFDRVQMVNRETMIHIVSLYNQTLNSAS